MVCIHSSLEGIFAKKNKTFTAFLGIRTTSLVWHFRLGHPSFEIVNQVVKEQSLPVSSYNFNKCTSCASCQLGKSERQPFHASTHVSLQPLELIHSDIWTSPVQSVSGFKYYVVFIDDWSRFTWIYPLHHKSEVFENFSKFKLLVETELTLLAHSHLSNRHWVDAFLTSVYVINRLPTPILNN